MHRLTRWRVACAWVGLTMALIVAAGCVSMPEPAELRATTADYRGAAIATSEDGRARFREIFCSLVDGADGGPDGEQQATASSCDGLLWRLADEQPAPVPTAAAPPVAAGLHIFVVSGAFGDCRKIDTVPYGDEIARLSAQGLKIEAVMVSGRSGTEHNARQIADAVATAGIEDDGRIVLVGYSKGAVDILQFLVDYPDLARRVAAVVSVAGPIYGSPLASDADWWYRTFARKAFSGMCDPGDGGVIASLRSDVRRQWLEDHSLPRNVQYYSLAAFTTAPHLARGLRMSWRILAEDDRRNDGQVLVGDAVIPHSTLLAYANADHWDVAIAIERQMPYLSFRENPRAFPRGRLLDAMLAYVSEAVDRTKLARDPGNGGR